MLYKTTARKHLPGTSQLLEVLVGVFPLGFLAFPLVHQSSQRVLFSIPGNQTKSYLFLKDGRHSSARRQCLTRFKEAAMSPHLLLTLGFAAHAAGILKWVAGSPSHGYTGIVWCWLTHWFAKTKQLGYLVVVIFKIRPIELGTLDMDI